MAERSYPPASTQTNSGGGQSLPETLRHGLEILMGADFSEVRVHEGAHVAGVGALAYVQGQDIHFAPGQYQPHTEEGQRLLGHELAHVVQQGGAVGDAPLAKERVQTTDTAPE